MAERYSKLFSLTKNLYSNTSPVIIQAGALLLDTKTTKVLAQLKFKNIDKRTIKSLKIQLQPQSN